jgi:16S rRNA (guanine966-N2)-methyltransferase
LRRKPKTPAGDAQQTELSTVREPGVRIVGGTMRGRKLLYNGDERTRPMKDRVREAVFNLVGPMVKGAHAIDLFAGTGALGFEAISRGAEKATFVEQHFPTAGVIRQNAALLDVSDRTLVYPGNTFIWVKQHPPAPDMPWLVFCSPPYAFYTQRQADMLALVSDLLDRAPTGSTFVVESDEQFDQALLPDASAWDVRVYPPAVVAIRSL